MGLPSCIAAKHNIRDPVSNKVQGEEWQLNLSSDLCNLIMAYRHIYLKADTQTHIHTQQYNISNSNGHWYGYYSKHLFFFVFAFFFLRYGLMFSWLVWSSVYRTGWPLYSQRFAGSTFQVLALSLDLFIVCCYCFRFGLWNQCFSL